MAISAAFPTSAEAASSEDSRARIKRIAFHVAVFVVAFLVLFWRRPDALLHAQFYAEDGKYWYADAYRLGFRCLSLPLDGYLNTVSRLIGLFALLFPFGAAPLIMNVAGLIGEILPIHVFLSSRFNAVPFAARMFGSLWYLFLPNSYEIHGSTTNLQWHLALVGCLVLLAELPATWGWRVLNLVVLVGLSLAGPLGILLIPIAAILRWSSKDVRYDSALWALIPGSLLQVIVILFSGSRPSPANGATFERLTGILGGQLFLSSVLGLKEFARLYLLGQRSFLVRLELLAMVIGLAVIAYAFARAPLKLRLFILFAAAVLMLGLSNPLVDPTSIVPQWQLLQIPGVGNRYYFFPMLAFFASLIWMLGIPTPAPKVSRCSAAVILFFLPFGVYTDRQHPKFRDLHFPEFAAEFERAAVGTRVTIPVYPGGWQWQMELIKK